MPIAKDINPPQVCAAAVLEKQNVMETCPLEFRVMPEEMIFQQTLNHVILVTKGERISELCSGQNFVQTVSLGTYQIHWNGSCFLSTACWSFMGVRDEQLRHALRHEWKSWNITGLTLPDAVRGISLIKNERLPRVLPD